MHCSHEDPGGTGIMRSMAQRQHLRRVIFALLLVAAPLQLPSAIAASNAATVIKIATISPDGTTWMRLMREGAQSIAEQTGGRVKFQFYPGGIMGNDQSLLRKIRIGQLQGGAVTGGSLIDIDPSFQLYSLPFLFTSLDEVSHVRKHLDTRLIAGLARKGMISFGLAEGGFAYLMSRHPISRLSELKARKVWMPPADPASIDATRKVGIAPVSLPLPDVLTGLQTDLVDTVATSPIAAIALQWHTRVKYLNETPLNYFVATLIVDRRVFEKLSPPDQEIMHRVMGETFAKIDAQNRRDNVSALSALAGQHISFTRFDPESLAELRKIAETVHARTFDSGVHDRNLVADLQNHLATYRTRIRAGSDGTR